MTLVGDDQRAEGVCAIRTGRHLIALAPTIRHGVVVDPGHPEALARTVFDAPTRARASAPRARPGSGEVDPVAWISRRPDSVRTIRPPVAATGRDSDDEAPVEPTRFVDLSPVCSVPGCRQALWAPTSLASGRCAKRDPVHLAAATNQAHR